jgi:hypothetical protein
MDTLFLNSTYKESLKHFYEPNKTFLSIIFYFFYFYIKYLNYFKDVKLV